MSWFLAFAGFAALIVLHEAGHFAAAKAVGMRAERFFLFFPPKLVSFKRGETEYGIGMVPLGGFVKITGMNPEEELPDEIKPRAYCNQPVWKRVVVISAGPAVNLVIAFLILFVLSFSLTEPSQNVGQVEAGQPATGVLQTGDRIVSIDGKTFGENSDVLDRLPLFAQQVATHECEGELVDGCRATTPAVVEVERDGSIEELAIYPVYDATAGIERTRLGFSYLDVPVDMTPAAAARHAGDFMWFVTERTVGTIAQIFNAERREELGSVVGGYEATRQAIEFDAERAWLLLAVISLSLGIINLFPFLPLDGGHIFWAVAEKLRGGKPISLRVMEKSSMIGFMLVAILFFIGVTNDLDRILSGEGFGVR